MVAELTGPGSDPGLGRRKPGRGLKALAKSTHPLTQGKANLYPEASRKRVICFTGGNQTFGVGWGGWLSSDAGPSLESPFSGFLAAAKSIRSAFASRAARTGARSSRA